MNTRVVTNGDVLDVNVRSLAPDVTLQFPQELGLPVTVDRMTGLKKSTSRMPPRSQKIVAITFPVDGPVRNFRALRD